MEGSTQQNFKNVDTLEKLIAKDKSDRFTPGDWITVQREGMLSERETVAELVDTVSCNALYSHGRVQ